MKEVRFTEYPSDAMDESSAGHEKNALWSLCGYWRVGILNPSCGAGAQGCTSDRTVSTQMKVNYGLSDSDLFIPWKRNFLVDKIETNLGLEILIKMGS